MNNEHPLTLTVEEAGRVLGVGRTTAYELVRSGDLKAIHLRRRIVVPVTHLAETLGVDRSAVWLRLAETATRRRPTDPDVCAQARPGRRVISVSSAPPRSHPLATLFDARTGADR